MAFDFPSVFFSFEKKNYYLTEAQSKTQSICSIYPTKTLYYQRKTQGDYTTMSNLPIEKTNVKRQECSQGVVLWQGVQCLYTVVVGGGGLRESVSQTRPSPTYPHISVLCTFTSQWAQLLLRTLSSYIYSSIQFVSCSVFLLATGTRGINNNVKQSESEDLAEVSE